MADYSLQEIRTMQEDAIRRVREMHERAKLSLENSNEAHFRETQKLNNQPTAPHKSTAPTQKPPNRQGYNRLGNMNAPSPKHHQNAEQKQIHKPLEMPEHKPIHKEPHKKEDNSFFGSGFLKSFDFNSVLKSFDIKNILNNPEQAFILMMLLLLLSEGADEMLIFALIYIML